MAVTLYKKGDECVVRGVACDSVRIDVSQIDYYKNILGYTCDINDLKVVDKPPTTKKPKNKKGKSK